MTDRQLNEDTKEMQMLEACLTANKTTIAIRRLGTLYFVLCSRKESKHTTLSYTVSLMHQTLGLAA